MAVDDQAHVAARAARVPMVIFGTHPRYGIMTGPAGRGLRARSMVAPAEGSLLQMLSRVCLFIALAVAVCVPAAGQVADESAVPRISLADLKKAVDAKQVLVVDVRDAFWYAEGHIPGAVNIPLEELQAKVSTLKGGKKAIVTYCA